MIPFTLAYIGTIVALTFLADGEMKVHSCLTRNEKSRIPTCLKLGGFKRHDAGERGFLVELYGWYNQTAAGPGALTNTSATNSCHGSGIDRCAKCRWRPSLFPIPRTMICRHDSTVNQPAIGCGPTPLRADRAALLSLLASRSRQTHHL